MTQLHTREVYLKPSKSHVTHGFKFAFFLVIFLNMVGCQNFVHKSTGQVMLQYSKSQAVPYALATDDALKGCALGEAFSPFLLSFERVSVDVDAVGILMDSLSGLCAQQEAWEQDLRYHRALYNGNSSDAKDALIAKKRASALAAKRQYSGYKRMVAYFGESCPQLKSKQDEFYYLVGLLNGLQASQNNTAADQISQVPLNIMNKVGRGAQCLSSEDWWGVPKAIEAMVWAMFNQPPENIEPLDVLNQASQLGREKGVRLSHIFEAEAYNASSDTQGLKAVIQDFANAPVNVSKQWQMLDVMAELYIQFFSDRLWTQDQGHRTPIRQLGQFWQAEPEEPTNDDSSKVKIDIDDLI